MIKGTSEKYLFKNRLQEYTQKSGLQLPAYTSKNEGFPHAPKFWAQVVVDGKAYASRGTFRHVKEAEQDAARRALEQITEIRKKVEFPTVQDPIYCKSILNEYCVKKNLRIPEYTTTVGDQKHPDFVSSLVFYGRTYTGEVAGSKKMAEQLAAHAAIQSLLESGSEDIRQIISSKVKIHEPAFTLTDSGSDRSNLKIVAKPGVSTESFEKTVIAFPSTPDMKSIGPSANLSGQIKRKSEVENSSQKRKQVYKQCRF